MSKWARMAAQATGTKTAGGVATPAPLSNVKPESLTTLDFLAKVLPGQGVYCLFRGQSKQHEWFSAIEELAQRTEQLRNETDVYFAVATFNEAGSRKQANVTELRSFRLDLDAGAKKLATQGAEKVYYDQQAAIADLVRFAKETGLVPSLIVSSGEGLHVYYVLDKPATPEQWRPVAEEMQRYCLQHGLKVDAAVTADHARVLRPIGTLHPNGKRVAVLKDTDKAYTMEQLAQVVGHVSDATPKYDLSVNADVQPVYDDTPADFDKIKAGCEAVRWAVENPAMVGEPYWRAVLGIVKFCENPVETAHTISNGHPGYDHDVTEKKLHGWNAGPTTCTTFAEHNRAACARCPHQGGADA